ncbi:hypothetical protein OH76DRAFT_197747 [Lentinus brumalis]|uniref:Uncharacterized protein n=1 Tax=Lentinus brumalis TaxID=2498619 RepID=A0A371DI65_9APHY|nr:hypothetical protein OH76DRAFT_197747 [Polyporus brumalis]
MKQYGCVRLPYRSSNLRCSLQRKSRDSRRASKSSPRAYNTVSPRMEYGMLPGCRARFFKLGEVMTSSPRTATVLNSPWWLMSPRHRREATEPCRVLLSLAEDASPRAALRHRRCVLRGPGSPADMLRLCRRRTTAPRQWQSGGYYPSNGHLGNIIRIIHHLTPQAKRLHIMSFPIQICS